MIQVSIAVISVRSQAMGGNSMFPNRDLQRPGSNQRFPQQNVVAGFGSGLNNQGIQPQQNQNPNQGQNQPFPQQNGFDAFGSINQFTQQSSLQTPNQQQFSQQNFPNQGQNQAFPQQNGQDPFGIGSNSQGNQQQFDQTQSLPNASTTPTPTQTSTPSQTQITNSMPFILCNRNCITTPEYNPVCGSDQNPYPNDRRLACVNRCGRRINPNWQGL